MQLEQWLTPLCKQPYTSLLLCSLLNTHVQTQEIAATCTASRHLEALLSCTRSRRLYRPLTPATTAATFAAGCVGGNGSHVLYAPNLDAGTSQGAKGGLAAGAWRLSSTQTSC